MKFSDHSLSLSLSVERYYRCFVVWIQRTFPFPRFHLPRKKLSASSLSSIDKRFKNRIYIRMGVEGGEEQLQIIDGIGIMGRRKEISVEQWPDFDVLAVKSGCITVKQQTIWRNRYQGNDVLGENYQLEIATFYTKFPILIFPSPRLTKQSPWIFLIVKKKKKKEKKNTRCIAKRTPPFTPRFPWNEMKRFLRTLIYSALCRILLSRLPGQYTISLSRMTHSFFKFAVKREPWKLLQKISFLQN